jgi:hypothetical protein
MARSRQNFTRSVDQQLPGTNPGQRALIEDYQPYKRSPKGRAIRALRTLFNLDKHRGLVPTHFYPLDYDATSRGRKPVRDYVRLKPRQKVKHGTPLVTWTYADLPPEMNIKLTINAAVAFDPAVVRPAPSQDIDNVAVLLETIILVCDEIVDRLNR